MRLVVEQTAVARRRQDCDALQQLLRLRPAISKRLQRC